MKPLQCWSHPRPSAHEKTLNSCQPRTAISQHAQLHHVTPGKIDIRDIFINRVLTIPDNSSHPRPSAHEKTLNSCQPRTDLLGASDLDGFKLSRPWPWRLYHNTHSCTMLRPERSISAISSLTVSSLLYSVFANPRVVFCTNDVPPSRLKVDILHAQ
jgi:hypothetical protein